MIELKTEYPGTKRCPCDKCTHSYRLEALNTAIGLLLFTKEHLPADLAEKVELFIKEAEGLI